MIRTHPVTKGLPATYDAPANEWYLWKPSPRLNKDVHVFVTLDPSNYPIGEKDIITEGDLPVVWTNTKYRMLYINMGHGPDGLWRPDAKQDFSRTRFSGSEIRSRLSAAGHGGGYE